MQPRKAYLLLPGTGALVIVTSHDSITDLALIAGLSVKYYAATLHEFLADCAEQPLN